MRAVVIVKEPGAGPDAKPSYSAMPVSAWYNFQRASNAPQLDPEEQTALFEQLQSLRHRPTVADALRQRLRGDVNEAVGAGDDDGDLGRENYRTAMAAAAAEAESASRKRARGGEGGAEADGAGAPGTAGGGAAMDAGDYNDGEGGPGDFLDDAYAMIDGSVPGTGGGLGGSGMYGVAGEGPTDADLAAGREFDVVGLEGGGEEVAIDYEPDWDDDAGDKGDQYAEAAAEGGVAPALSAADMAQGEEALRFDGEEASAREDEDEEADAPGVLAAEARRKAAEAASAAAAASAASASKVEVEAGRAVKRARLEASTPLGQLKEEVRASAEAVPFCEPKPFTGAQLTSLSVATFHIPPLLQLKRLIVSMGGRITTKVLSKHYRKRKEGEGKAFEALLVAALKAVTRRVLLADQSVEYILKQEGM